jgi:hypothetical protein
LFKCHGELLGVLQVVDTDDGTPPKVNRLSNLILIGAASDRGVDPDQGDSSCPPGPAANEYVLKLELDVGKEAK